MSFKYACTHLEREITRTAELHYPKFRYYRRWPILAVYPIELHRLTEVNSIEKLHNVNSIKKRLHDVNSIENSY